MTDLTSAVEAAARAHFDRGQAQRRDDGRLNGSGQPWQWEDLTDLDRHAVRAFVLPLVVAAFDSQAETHASTVAPDYERCGLEFGDGWTCDLPKGHD